MRIVAYNSSGTERKIITVVDDVQDLVNGEDFIIGQGSQNDIFDEVAIWNKSLNDGR